MATDMAVVDGRVTPKVRWLALGCLVGVFGAIKPFGSGLGMAMAQVVTVLLSSLLYAPVLMLVARTMWRWRLSYLAAYRLHAGATLVAVIPAYVVVGLFPSLESGLVPKVVEVLQHLVVPPLVWKGATVGEETVSVKQAFQMTLAMVPFALFHAAIWAALS